MGGRRYVEAAMVRPISPLGDGLGVRQHISDLCPEQCPNQVRTVPEGLVS